MKDVRIVVEIIEKVLFGKMSSLNELYSAWPEMMENDTLFESIYDDIESVVEHYSIPQNKVNVINEKLFDKSMDYRKLVVDYVLLKFNLDPVLTNRLRNEFLKKTDLSFADFESEASQFKQRSA